MNLSIEKTMTVNEVADIMGVTPEAIKKHVREMFPEIIRNGVTTNLNEKQVTLIKTKMTPTTQVVANKTDLEKELIIRQALMFQQEKIDKLQLENKEMKPKALFYDQVTGSTETIEMKEAAKVLNMGIGRNKLFELLRNNKILDNKNQPYQRYVDSGYFRLIETQYEVNGEIRINRKTVVFQKGLDFIRKLLWNLRKMR